MIRPVVKVGIIGKNSYRYRSFFQFRQTGARSNGVHAFLNVTPVRGMPILCLGAPAGASEGRQGEFVCGCLAGGWRREAISKIIVIFVRLYAQNDETSDIEPDGGFRRRDDAGADAA
ncbi:MAG: hypothetical protein IJS62_06445, partial [Bacteroidales bacterium]|nr:hypothetical protein [Bacteroidales bacterium]